MESPVVVDKPPEYHGNNDRGFPFDEEESSGAWSELAARHPDIAARLRQRPATWARKRRPSSQDATDDFGDSFGGFDRFPFDDIPPEFREHFPSHWNRRYSPRDEPPPQTQPTTPPQQQTAATQTDHPEPPPSTEQTNLPQYGLRNTVDLGQKSPADPSLVDADDRNQRSMSAPPDSCPNQQSKMSGQSHQEQAHQPSHNESQSNVRHIPIFVEGRDEPVINRSDHGAHYADTKPAYSPPHQQPHIDREQYFADDGPSFHHPPNFTRAFGTPFNKGFRQGPQPFVQQKVYPQTAFTRGPSPQRSQSPKPQMHPEEQHYVKVPVHHDHATPKTETPSKQPPKQPPQPSPQQQAPPPREPTPQREQTPPQPKQATSNDPITLILSIQTDVLNLMTEVENFTGTKKDKKYLFLDEMLTRNLIKLDNIETDGKENIRQARKEAIKCIQKCIAVLEAKADNKGANTSQPHDVEMIENTEGQKSQEQQVVENGEVEMKETAKEETKVEEPQGGQKPQAQQEPPQAEQQVEKPKEDKKEEPKQEESTPAAPADNKEISQPQAADTRPDDIVTEQKADAQADEQKKEAKAEDKSPKKGAKTVKKRDKSKDNKDTPKDSNKEEKTSEKSENEVMQVDEKGDKPEAAKAQSMDVDGAASQ